MPLGNEQDVRKVLEFCLTDAEYKELPNFYRGKVR
jgi:hypothetical protein